MIIRILEANLNYTCQAQHLMMQYLAERGVGLAIVVEPYKISDENRNKVNSGSAAIVRTTVDLSPPLRIIERGERYVAAKWGQYHVISCYAHPKWVSGKFDMLLERVGMIADDIRCDTSDALIIIVGDFNARSPALGNRHRNSRGLPLEGWMDGHGLVLHKGRINTCVSHKGIHRKHYDDLPKCRTRS